MGLGNYVPTTTLAQKEMLESMGIQKIEELYTVIPDNLKLQKLAIPAGKSELEVRRLIKKLGDKNQVFETILRGGGAYHHYIPALVKQIAAKEEFLTAYTPYQAEISQGILQVIFEFQTMICELTGMAVANASVYDGATAAAEAVNMTIKGKKRKVLVSETVHPMTLETIKTYSAGQNLEIITVPSTNGVTDSERLAALLDQETACFYVQSPNYYGIVEPAETYSHLVHEQKAKFIMGVNPTSLAILKTPAECGADIAVGEGQPLGIGLSFGGPYLGFMAATKAMTRNLPGRVVGQTVDTEGERAFTLTLQAREQHIKREKASSNICSNQAHCALIASVYLTTMGQYGLKNVATQSYSNTHYLAERLGEIKGFELVYTQPYFHEVLMTTPIEATILLDALAKKNILGGLVVGSNILWCATEMITKEEIDEVVVTIKEVLASCN
ncbi:aminomethyl-transferring glycine dehydrogenase subunit GcvPA [Vagococcus intermedius]|uniref:Probable glycine dehydrogenase (decarboxylating) subunit 1 n=1 Tax=Vagococcus intermedius TaxID=2991418 RepID=A0AAF0CTJ5_9ENTE|nr:aminomethyl-transferring glycine dehydrogenase subunit GcvPA [Vagococcus intermedius]WEG72678.1 aminomethyl-transferring glycine dehydrogenase subunit GcvPA [Vagococcus intermedius]WEG74763.1 aminomethyl-transferring glycine dehydrogenase subunit GcvPA [Vagococcus intermedius]